MSDTMEVWQLCEHGESKGHIAAQKGMAQMMWTCPGGKRIVLRRFGGSKSNVYSLEVSDDE